MFQCKWGTNECAGLLKYIYAARSADLILQPILEICVKHIKKTILIDKNILFFSFLSH